MISTIKKRIYDEMGNGFDEYVLLINDDRVSIIHVGTFADEGMLSTVIVTK